MTTESLLLECDAFRSVFDEWTTEQASLDAQLSESLAALTAYQSHLDAWQKQLVEERDGLQVAREQFERERAEGNKDSTRVSAEMVVEIDSLRSKNAELTADLSTRGEEFRELEQRCAEMAAKLEAAQAKERELMGALDQQSRAKDEELAKSTSQGPPKQASESQLDAANADGSPSDSCCSNRAEPPAADAIKREAAGSSAVLGSIVEQFGKLRLQRANDRQSNKRSR